MSSQPLTIDHIIDTPGETLSIVVDFPLEEYPDLEKAIRTFWEKRAGTMGKEVRIVPSDKATGLSHPILYGTFTIRPDNPVFRAFDGTPLSIIENNTANFTGDIQGIIVGNNQFGNGFMVIFAATSPEQLADLHHFLDGSKSLIAVINGEIQESNIFDRQFRTLIPDLPIVDVLDDVDSFFTLLEEVHPHPLANLSPEDYISFKKEIRKNLQNVAAGRDSVKASIFALELAKVAASLKDGHTRIKLNSFTVDESNTSPHMLPFKLDYRFGVFEIKTASEQHADLMGRRLVTINGSEVIEVLSTILEIISGDTLPYKLASFIDNQRVYWSLLSPIAGDSIIVVTEAPEGKVESQAIPLLSLAEHDSLVPNLPQFQTTNLFRYFDNEQICYYRFDNFIHNDEQRQYVDKLFQDLRSKNTKALLIDLRYNEGGSSQFGDYLLNYLTSESYLLASRMDAKLSEALYNKYSDYRQFESLTGMTVSRRSEPRQPKDMGLKFNGKLFVLIGPRTFSSAGLFAAIVKDYNLGTLIGEETGGTRQHFGDPAHVTLPTSGLGISISCKLWFAPVVQIGDDHHGTIPDISVERSILATYIEADDPVFEFALDKIREKIR